MADTRYIVDVFKEIVANTALVYDRANGEKPFFMHGHILDVVNRLAEYENDNIFKWKKYPLIILIEDIERSHPNPLRFEATVSPRFIICTDTVKEYHSPDRWENIIKPILFPIYDLFVQKIAESTDIDQSDIEEVKQGSTDVARTYWGTQKEFGSDAHILNDHLDAIDITFNELNISKYQPDCNRILV
jgi:hypothetical protein